MAPAELGQHDALQALPSADAQEQERLQGGHASLQGENPSSTGSSPAGPPNLQRLSFVKNPGLNNIQTPFASSKALTDPPWQPQERPSGCSNPRLESIAGEHPSAVKAITSLAFETVATSLLWWQAEAACEQ